MVVRVIRSLLNKRNRQEEASSVTNSTADTSDNFEDALEGDWRPGAPLFETHKGNGKNKQLDAELTLPAPSSSVAPRQGITAGQPERTAKQSFALNHRSVSSHGENVQSALPTKPHFPAESLPATTQQQREAARSQHLRERLTKLHGKCAYQNVSTAHWSGPGNGAQDGANALSDTIEITLPKICPQLITASQNDNEEMTIKPTFKVDGSSIFSLFRSSVMPICFGLTFVPLVNSSDPDYLDAFTLADLADIEIVARGKDACRGIEIKGRLEFAHDQKLFGPAFGQLSKTHPHLKMPSWLNEENDIYQQLHTWTLSTKKVMHYDLMHGFGGAPHAVETEEKIWEKTNNLPYVINADDEKAFRELDFTFSWCENRDATSGEIFFRVQPKGGRERTINSLNIISLAICQFDKHSDATLRNNMDKVGERWQSLPPDSPKHMSLVPKALAGRMAKTSLLKYLAVSGASLGADLAGLNPRSQPAANMILFCIVQALNQRIAYNPRGQSLAFRCFYFLLFPHSEQDSKLDMWLQGFLDQVLQIFLEKKTSYLPHDLATKKILETWVKPHGRPNVCLQNDEITLRLAAREKLWERVTINYKNAAPQSSWSDYLHPKGLVRGLGQGLGAVQSFLARN